MGPVIRSDLRSLSTCSSLLPSHMTAEYASYFWAISDGRSACSSASSLHCCRALRSLNMKLPDSLNAFSIAVSMLDEGIQKCSTQIKSGRYTESCTRLMNRYRGARVRAVHFRFRKATVRGVGHGMKPRVCQNCGNQERHSAAMSGSRGVFQPVGGFIFRRLGHDMTGCWSDLPLCARSHRSNCHPAHKCIRPGLPIRHVATLTATALCHHSPAVEHHAGMRHANEACRHEACTPTLGPWPLGCCVDVVTA